MAGALLLALALGAGAGSLLTQRRLHAADTLVSVNGATIKRAAYQARLDTVTGGGVFRQMVEDELETQYDRAHGLWPKEGAIQAQYDRLARQPDFARQCDAMGLTPDDVKRNVSLQLARNARLAQAAKKTAVSEAQMRAYYQHNIAPGNIHSRFYQPEVVTVAVIITPSQREAQQAMSLLATGVPFNTAASIYSHDVSKSKGGQLAPIPRGRTHAAQDPAFERALFALSPGQQSGPTQFHGIWWIIRCLQKTPAVTLPYAQVRDACRVALVAAKTKSLTGKGAGPKANPLQAIDPEFTQFAQKARIHAFDARYERMLMGLNP